MILLYDLMPIARSWERSATYNGIYNEAGPTVMCAIILETIEDRGGMRSELKPETN